MSGCHPVVQAVPFRLKSVGLAKVPLEVPWNPKVAWPPAASSALWTTLLAVTARDDPDMFAFQAWVICCPDGRVNASFQPLTREDPVLVMVTSAVKPPCQEFAPYATLQAAVWLDRIAAINGVKGGMGLRAHLDEALKQEGSGDLVVQLVIYDLAGRDCAALASNGELGPNDLDKYKSQYIHPITAILSESKYAGLRIATVIEPDSLPNLVTNAGGTPTTTDACVTMKGNGNYEKGVSYALDKLGAIPNVYNYIDAAHHGWLGWDSNLGPAVQQFHKVATTNGASVNDVAGFIVNTANYSPTKEPYLKVTDTVGGQTVRQSKWVDWNQYVDEQSFAQALRDKLVAAGFNSGLGMLIDTSRNGWGGSARPGGPGAQTTVDGYVDASRIDRRIHAGNWCNQSGAGIGARPTAAPAAGIDAYVWVKPPGESDGNSTPVPNDEGKGFDRMCDPTYGGNARNGNNPPGSLPDSPLAGHWLSAQFQQLLRNAYPPLP